MSSAFESLLWTYDLAGGWREGILHQKLTPAEVLSHCPTLKEEQLSGGFMYFDARVDDARLTLALVRTAAFHGATVTNHAEVIETTRDQHGKVNGAIVYADAREIRIKARVVIMATGVWLRDWNGLKKGEASPLNIRNDCTVTIPVAGRSRRATITRWGNVSYLGTTDEDYQGDLNDVHCNRTELDFLLEGANSALKTDLRPEDVVGSIAGCRPLVGVAGGKTVEMKRNHEIRVSADGTEAHFVSDIIQADPSLMKPIVAGLPYTEAEVVYAVRHELASTVDDVLSRRIRARLMARDASAAAAERVGEILQQELRLHPEHVAKQVASYQAAIKHEKSMLMGASE